MRTKLVSDRVTTLLKTARGAGGNSLCWLAVLMFASQPTMAASYGTGKSKLKSEPGAEIFENRHVLRREPNPPIRPAQPLRSSRRKKALICSAFRFSRWSLLTSAATGHIQIKIRIPHDQRLGTLNLELPSRPRSFLCCSKTLFGLTASSGHRAGGERPGAFAELRSATRTGPSFTALCRDARSLADRMAAGSA